jgi:hypothetical protein
MRKKPRGRAARIAWLRRRIVVLRAELRRGFREAWYRSRHWTIASQERTCRAELRDSRLELAKLVA